MVEKIPPPATTQSLPEEHETASRAGPEVPPGSPVVQVVPPSLVATVSPIWSGGIRLLAVWQADVEPHDTASRP